MSEVAIGTVTPEWIDGIVNAVFGGATPPVVDELVDRAACAASIPGGKLALVFTVQGGPERPRVRVRDDGESERLLGVARRHYPDAARLVDELHPAEVAYETDGERWSAFLVGLSGDELVAGRIVESGADLAFDGHPSLDAIDAPPPIAAKAARFAGDKGGMWFAAREGARVQRVVWSSEGSHAASLDEVIATFGASPGVSAVKRAYDEAGLEVWPYSVEFEGDTVSIGLWGARLIGRPESLPSIFAGGVPTAAAVAEEIAKTLPEPDQASGRDVVRDVLFPAMMQLQPRDLDATQHAGVVWRRILDTLAFEAPADRLSILRGMSVSHRLAVIQKDALQLAIARYVDSHDVAPPADLPADLVALDGATIRARAVGLKEETLRLKPVAEADANFDLHRLPGTIAEVGTILALLERAITGEFTTAESALHDFLVNLGPTGYDDDVNAEGVEHVDLEASRDAVLEEALAKGDDDGI